MRVTAANRRDARELSLILGAGVTFCSLIPTAYAAAISNSVTLFADLLRCAVEFGVILVSLVIVRRVGRADRAQFNYGSGKLEHLGGLYVGLAMLASVLVLAVTAAQRLLAPCALSNARFGLAFGVLSVAGNVFMWGYYRRRARLDNSPLLEAQGKLFRAKTGASAVVVLSLAVAMALPDSAASRLADPVGSLILACVILASAIGLISSASGDLLDRSIDEALQLVVLRVLVKHEREYRGLGRIRSRRAGNRVMIEISLEFGGEQTVAQIGPGIERIREELKREIPYSEITIVPSGAGANSTE